jgi:hypothetical protein
MRKTCTKCKEEFELLPGKPGLATVCLRCTESPEEATRKSAAENELYRLKAAASREQSRNLQRKAKHDRELESMSFEKVPGKSFTFGSRNPTECPPVQS